MITNEVDAAFASTISGQAKEMETSPRGIVCPQPPARDKEGWARVNKIGPYFLPQATCGSGLPAQHGESSYPYPIFMAYASQPADLIYGVTKAMILGYDAYKDGAPGADGLDASGRSSSGSCPTTRAP